MNKPIRVLLMTALIINCALSIQAQNREFYEIRIFHVKNEKQEGRVDHYLQNAYLPALHRAGFKQIGVFKPVETDTADRKIYLLIPFSSLEKFAALYDKLSHDRQYQADGKDYLNAVYNDPPFTRTESIILQAFPDMPRMKAPALSSPREERVYELRSYEGHTEKIYKNKVKMFNEGGEIKLFERLGFNAVFYGEVLAGSRTPNLMYMTTFANKASRDEHWKTFGSDPEWKKISGMPEYQHNVSKIDIFFLRPTSYSDY